MSQFSALKLSTMSTEEQAAFWMMRHLDGPLSAQDERAFAEWLQYDKHRRAFRALERTDDTLGRNAEQILAFAFEGELHTLDEQKAERWQLPSVASLAAALTLVVGLLISINMASPPATESFATSFGVRHQVALDDGSLVTMNARSAMDVRLSKEERFVALDDGEAFFNVAREPERVFRVETKHGLVKVTGTKFNVWTRRDETAVSVVSGTVDVTPEGGMTHTLLAGDQITFGPRRERAVIERFDPQHVLAWRQGQLIFRDAPLRDVVEELNRHFRTPIILADDAPQDAPVNGTFQTDDQGLAIRGLTVALDLEATTRPGGVVLSVKEGTE